MNNDQRDAWLLRRSIAIESEFVPFSKSRNKDSKDDRGRTRLSLNWKVTLLVNARAVLTTDRAPRWRTRLPLRGLRLSGTSAAAGIPQCRRLSKPPRRFSASRAG